MSDSIKVSPKHGLNPTIPQCFWCGKDKSEIALLGKMDKEDSPAPRRVIVDYEPCDKCKELFSKGIHVVGVSEEPVIKGMFPISEQPDGKKLYPTGTMFVSSEDWIHRLLSEPEEKELLDAVLKQRKMLMPEEICAAYVEQAKQLEVEDIIEDQQEEKNNENN